jgi:uncharacterized protein
VSVLALIRRFPLASYFALAYALSGVALLVVGLPKLGDATGRSMTSLVMFPVMVIGVGVIGVALTWATDGVDGIRQLRARITRRVERRWLLVLALPPVAILAVLGALDATVSRNFAPSFLVFGIAAGAFAGFFEEFGWTGFAYPRMRSRFGSLRAALLLGVLWGLWHLPIADSLGAASPHGRYWPEFFAAFVVAIVALRVLIAWVYVNTGSLRMAQLLHAFSTGSLVILGAPKATPGQEALWYLAYAVILWTIVIAVVVLQGSTLCGRRRTRRQSSMSASAVSS